MIRTLSTAEDVLRRTDGTGGRVDVRKVAEEEHRLGVGLLAAYKMR